MKSTGECQQLKKRGRGCIASAFGEYGAKTKKAHTELIIGNDFQRKAEAKIGHEEDSGQKEGQDTDEAALKDSDSSVNLIRFDSLCQGVGRRRQRTDLKEIDGTVKQEHQKEHKITDLPSHRRSVIDEDITLSDLSERIHHLQIVIRIKAGSEERDVWPIRIRKLDMHRVGQTRSPEKLKVQVEVNPRKKPFVTEMGNSEMAEENGSA